MPSRPVYRVAAVDSKGWRLHVSVADCKGMTLGSRRDHMERVAENDAIMARHTLTYDEQLHTLMAGTRHLNMWFATCFRLLHNHTGVWRSTVRSISLPTSAWWCWKTLKSAHKTRTTNNNFAQQMRDDRDEVILIRDHDRPWRMESGD